MTTILGFAAAAMRTIVLPAGQRQRRAVEALGLVSHAVADSRNHDVRPARNLGHATDRILVRHLPQQLDRGADYALEVFQAQVVGLAAHQFHLCRLERRGMVAPVVDD